MIKKTLYFGNPTYLSLHNNQLVIRLLPRKSINEDINPDESFPGQTRTIPIEDIGVILLDHRQITITQPVITALLGNNSALITCDHRGLPVGLMLPLFGNTTQSETFQFQIEASLPLKKQLWQQTIQAKIQNQAQLLNELNPKAEIANMLAWAKNVRSGDPDNLEGRAAAYYWKNIFKPIPDIPTFTRDRNGKPPNHFLNFGYTILRGLVARALVCGGLLPTLGIHHHNRYNAYCLADDIMEPYRPYVDRLVYTMVCDTAITESLTRDHKAKLLTIPTLEVIINNKHRPLMVAVGETISSLKKCMTGEQRKLAFPNL